MCYYLNATCNTNTTGLRFENLDICIVVAACPIMAHSITLGASGPPLSDGNTAVFKNGRQSSEGNLQAFSEQGTLAVARFVPTEQIAVV